MFGKITLRTARQRIVAAVDAARAHGATWRELQDVAVRAAEDAADWVHNDGAYGVTRTMAQLVREAEAYAERASLEQEERLAMADRE